MKLSEFITELQQLKKKLGDPDVQLVNQVYDLNILDEFYEPRILHDGNCVYILEGVYIDCTLEEAE